MTRPSARAFFLICLASVGGCTAGGCVGFLGTPMDRGPVVYAPLPHHVAPSPESPSFRFAMVHDVVHERYSKHGTKFYEERERLARERLAVLPRDSESAFNLTDDIAVGLDRRGHTKEAVALMRDKLARQEALGLGGKDLYSSYANLGELLVRENLWGMMKGDETARAGVQEGRLFLRKSLQVNPQAHFGREEWQTVAIDALLDFGEWRGLLRKADLIGDRLDRELEFVERQRPESYSKEFQTDLARPYAPRWAVEAEDIYSGAKTFPTEPDAENRSRIRSFVAEVGGEKTFKDTSHLEVQQEGRARRAPFDEPALWLIGEWRQGSGPNPHYALCLGEIMLRVGQRYLAWNCYERASRMADQFWPTPELQQFLRDHCRGRQQAIEKTLPDGEVTELRPRFEKELAFGEQYQRDYQAYEEAKIQGGADLNDEHFYDDFHASRPAIASKVGPEEWYAGERRSFGIRNKLAAFASWGLLSGGAILLLGMLLLSRFARHDTPKLLVSSSPLSASERGAGGERSAQALGETSPP